MRVSFSGLSTGLSASFGCLGAAGMLLLPLSSPAAARPHHHSASHAMVRHASYTRPTHAYASLSMTPERATEIQTALIGKGYLSGEPTGSWDSASFAAMQKLQSDNGWQTKLVPDSRALIKLGLGPGAAPVAAATATQVPAPTLNGPSIY